MTSGPDRIELTEYVPARFAAERIPQEWGTLLFRAFGTQVSVEFPTPKTDHQWELVSQGWVGHIPLTAELHLTLLPKVPLANLFRMWEYAYRLRSRRFLDGLIGCDSIEEFYEQLARILAGWVLDRTKKGLYREYVAETERLPYVRGRMNVRSAIRRPWDPRIECRFEEHTPDIEENRILAWTLDRVIRSGICTERVLPTIRRAYRALQGTVGLVPYGADACVGRQYNRLNADYQPMHALARFFLEQTGPTHEVGDRSMIPFLVDMASLFEMFVAEWMTVHLPAEFELQVQKPMDLDEAGTVRFVIDLVIADAITGEARYVLDTKYKAPDGPAADDIQQVVAYAEARHCEEAILVYPTPLPNPLDTRVGDIRVRTLAFPLDGNLEEAGQALLNEIFGYVNVGG